MISVILLSGGVGSRINSAIPKQYLPLKNKEIIHFSFEQLKRFDELVVVADPQYHSKFPGAKLALPGKRRQDSVYNGLLQTTGDWILVHDGARPFINKEMIDRLIEEGQKGVAATLARPVPFTIKEADINRMVTKTLDRSQVWEIQTPQLVRRDILLKGFDLVHEKGIDVTDDVSIAELLGHPVKLVMGSPFNFKITSAEDLKIAEGLVGYL